MAMKQEIRQILSDTKRVMQIAWEHNKTLMLATAGIVTLVAFAPFVQNFAIGQLVNELVRSVGVGALSDTAVFFLAAALVAGVVYAAANTIQFYLVAVLHKVFFKRFAVEIHEKIAELDIRMHEDAEKKNLITKVQENAMWRAPEFLKRYAYLGQNLLECSFATVVFLSADWMIGLAVFAASIPRLLVDVRYNHELWEVETELAETRRKFWHTRYFLVDLRALTEVKLFQTISFFVARLGEHLELINEKELGASKRNVRQQLWTLIVSEGVAVTAIVIFVMRVVHGELEAGTLAFYLASLAVFRSSLNMLSQNVGSQFQDGKFVNDMFTLFDIHSRQTVQSGNRVERIDSIVFEDVSFRYKGMDRDILSGFSMEIHRGQTIGLVAPNGSGKSTLAKLLCRMYEPTGGRILVNGMDYLTLDLEHWQSLLGVMLQEYRYYEHLNVETAIRIGHIRRNGSESKTVLERSIDAADAREFIDALPRKQLTLLGREFKDGIALSGGQYQKLAIARLLYRQPELAIYDEPTSAIDGEAEARLFESLLSDESSPTRILISHRFYTLRKADRICVLSNGRLAEQGTHEELMALGGIYAERYEAQANEYR